MIQEYQLIEDILADYKDLLYKDFSIYKKHVYRIFNYAIYFDNSSENIKKYAIASVFHDIGIWTDSFDYLKPSIVLAIDFLKLNNLENWQKEIALMIANHHKIISYKGSFSKTVNTFRKADWIDVTYGIKKYKMPKTSFKYVQKTFKNNGFHLFLLKQWFAWFLKHPFSSLPMFKW